MKTKICSQCKGKPKPLSEFHKDKTGKYGVASKCKLCHNKRIQRSRHTKTGLLQSVYSHQRQTSKKRGHKPPTYTVVEFKGKYVNDPDFVLLFNNWVLSGFKKELTPSFDRADDYKGYSFNNLNKWMSWGDHNKKYPKDALNGINNKQNMTVIGIHKITGKKVEFYSQGHAARKLGISPSLISLCINGYRISAAGYYWETIEG